MLSPERSCLRPGRPGTVATTSASLRYWNSARQRHCRPSERYQNIPASLPTRSPSHPRKPAPKAGFSTFESGCGRETDCLLEGDGFELVWGFSCQVVVFGFLPVLCSELESRSSSRRLRSGSRSDDELRQGLLHSFGLWSEPVCRPVEDPRGARHWALFVPQTHMRGGTVKAPPL